MPDHRMALRRDLEPQQTWTFSPSYVQHVVRWEGDVVPVELATFLVSVGLQLAATRAAGAVFEFPNANPPRPARRTIVILNLTRLKEYWLNIPGGPFSPFKVQSPARRSDCHLASRIKLYFETAD